MSFYALKDTCRIDALQLSDIHHERSRDSLCWPYGAIRCDGRVVSDSYNNRILLWRLAEDLAP